MLIIGIAGGSGSGKTTVVKAITEQLKDKVTVIPQDSYYKDLSHATEEEKRVHNFDHPDSIDFELLRHQLKELRDGKSVDQPVYSYITCGRSKTETVKVHPTDIIIVEGILIFTERCCNHLCFQRCHASRCQAHRNACLRNRASRQRERNPEQCHQRCNHLLHT